MSRMFDYRKKTHVEHEQRGLIHKAEDVTWETLTASTHQDTATPKSALNLTAVYSAMYIISSSFAQLPLKVLCKDENGVVKNANNHPAARFLSFRTDEFQSSYKWRETEQFRCLGWGNAYTEIIRKRGDIIALETYPPWLVNLVEVSREKGKSYLWSVRDEDGSNAHYVNLENMIHIKDIGYNSKLGESRIKMNASALDWGLSMQDYGKKFFGSNGSASGMITPKGDLNKESWAFLKKIFSKASTVMNSESNNTMLLPAELQYQSFTVPPEVMQFLESRTFSRSEIASIFNVPPHMIGALENATFSNISEQAIQFVKYTMMPWVRIWEEELNYKIFSQAERKKGLYVKFNLAGLLRGTPKDRADFYKIMIDEGIYSRNEVRVMEDMNPKDTLDEMVISQNVKSTRYMEAEADLKQQESEKAKKEGKDGN